MTSAILIDTDAAIRSLTKAKMPEAQARAIVDVLKEGHEGVATRNDLTALKSELKATIYGAQIAGTVAIITLIKALEIL